MWGNLGISLFGPLTGALDRHHDRVGGAGDRWRSSSAAPSARCCSAPRRSSARPPGRRRWSSCAACSAAAARWCRRCSTSARTSAGRRWRSSSSPPRPSPWSARRGVGRSCIVAGAVATMMAVRPLGSVRLLRKVMVWLVLAASVFLFVEVLLQPRQAIPQDCGARLLARRRPGRGRRGLLRAAGRRLQPALAYPQGRVLGRLARLRARRDRLLRARASSPSPTSAPAT